MTPPLPVTVICATRNARDAVRLTLASFHRHTPPVAACLIADNDSTDGTLDDLRAVPWLRVFSIEERLAGRESPGQDAARCPTHDPGGNPGVNPRAEVAKPHEWGWDGRSGPDFPSSQPASAGFATSARGFTPALPVPTSHGAALDWLAARVATPYFLTLDSDVEFLEPGWLTAMLGQLVRERLVALGEYEAGQGGYRPRLAPHVALWRTAAWRALGTSFGSLVTIRDPVEAQRWLARPRGFNLDPAELAAYPSGAFYATGARLFERLLAAGLPWAALPAIIARQFVHLGHMSWAGAEPGELPGVGALRADHTVRAAYVRERLSEYAPWPPPPCGG